MALDEKEKAIAKRLRWAREQAGLSQGQVAKLMNLHRPTISQIEGFSRSVKVDELAKFSEIYGIETSWLIEGDDTLPGVRDPRIQLAARELSKLRTEDLDSILRLIQVLRGNAGEE